MKSCEPRHDGVLRSLRVMCSAIFVCRISTNRPSTKFVLGHYEGPLFSRFWPRPPWPLAYFRRTGMTAYPVDLPMVLRFIGHAETVGFLRPDYSPSWTPSEQSRPSEEQESMPRGCSTFQGVAHFAYLSRMLRLDVSRCFAP